ncbi:ABC transporter permease [Kitasatospora sp. NPDC096147]|uniref:ABC transporter permease n=1 Tax=Kitasatospora sp. NPDC096147 TaxID=3364093 RepID=UPI003817057A
MTADLPPTPRRIAVVCLVVPLLVAFALWAFAWPAARLAPRDLPVGVAGPAAATAVVKEQLAQQKGAFEVHEYADGPAARTAVEQREVYGALVVGPQGPELYTASAAGPVVAQLLQGASAHLGGGAAGAGGVQPKVTDVVPAPAADPRGAVLGAGLLPLVLAGIASGALVTVLRLRGAAAIGSLLGAAALTGLVAVAVGHAWLGALSGNWAAEAGVFGLTALAVGATAAGLAALIGTPGIGVTALLMVLVGNAFSGVTSAPELLPGAARLIGAQLPPGAAGSALRSVAFFDGAAIGTPLLTLGLWAGLGLAVVGLVAARQRAAAPGVPVVAAA